MLKSNNVVKEIPDKLTYQEELSNNYIAYGYTIDNPNIILNPYEVSPLTALIMFETEDYVNVKVTTKGKNNDDISYITNSNKYHYLPIYGMYPNYDNTIIIEYKDIYKVFTIKTSSLPEDIILNYDNEVTNDLYFNSTNYLYAYDKYNQVRWYYTDNYIGNITKIENNHLIISNNQIIDNSTTGIVEMDLLGRIYKEYIINNYLGNSIVKNNNILTENYQIDRQTGTITKVNNEVNTNFDIKLDTNYNYYNVKVVRFGELESTESIKKNIMIFNYKNLEGKYNLSIEKEYNRLKIKGEFNKKDKVYLILDRLFAKKVYEINNNKLIINTTNLSGTYDIYIKVNKKLYKVNRYIEFK